MYQATAMFRSQLHTCMYVCMYVSIYIYLCIYVYVYMYICMKRSKASTTAQRFWHVHSQVTVSDQCPWIGGKPLLAQLEWLRARLCQLVDCGVLEFDAVLLISWAYFVQICTHTNMHIYIYTRIIYRYIYIYSSEMATRIGPNAPGIQVCIFYWGCLVLEHIWNVGRNCNGPAQGRWFTDGNLPVFIRIFLVVESTNFCPLSRNAKKDGIVIYATILDLGFCCLIFFEVAKARSHDHSQNW